MTTAWGGATKMLATMAALAVGALSIGCGPAPGYEPEPRMPVGYTPAPGEALPEQGEQGEPLSSAELARTQAQPQMTQALDANGDIAVGGEPDQYSDTDPSALTEFKPALEGHGQWVDDSTYGTVWVPTATEVGTDFQPYVSGGHWTYDDATSWVWVSDYSWGWAPFHYGRWVNVSHHGWVWIPGRTYAGAWVVWRTGGPDYGYVGWAPAGPDWYWYNGVAVGWTWGWGPSWGYCHRDYMYDRGLYGHVVRGPGAHEMEGRTRPYTPAAPVVAGGGRVPANPTVAGAGGAGVGGRVAASPRVGPRPGELGIPATAVMKPPTDHMGLARANAFASPRSAVALGGAPPAGTRRRAPDPRGEPLAAGNGRVGGVDRTSPFVASRIDAAARAPQTAGVNGGPRPAAMNDTRAMTAPRGPSPAFGSTPGASSAPVRSAGPVATPSRAPSQSFSTHSNPMPTYRSSPTMTTSSPSYHPSSPSVSHSSPSVSHSSPSVSHSSPSVSHSSPSVSHSSPSRSAPSRGGRR